MAIPAKLKIVCKSCNFTETHWWVDTLDRDKFISDAMKTGLWKGGEWFPPSSIIMIHSF